MEKDILNLSIILMGFNLFFSDIPIDLFSVFFILLLIAFSIIVCVLLGRLFGVSQDLSILLGIGNGICGASAIAAASSILKSKKNNIAISITIINLAGVVLMLVLPALLKYIDINDYFSGFVIGGVIQAVGHVTGAAFSMNSYVGEYAIIVKMIRILMLGPIIVFMSIYFRSNKDKKNYFYFPSFVFWFLVVVVIRNLVYIPEDLLIYIERLSKYLLTAAMTAIGLKITVKEIAQYGMKPLFISFFGSIFQILLIISFVLLFY